MNRNLLSIIITVLILSSLVQSQTTQDFTAGEIYIATTSLEDGFYVRYRMFKVANSIVWDGGPLANETDEYNIDSDDSHSNAYAPPIGYDYVEDDTDFANANDWEERLTYDYRSTFLGSFWLRYL